MSIYSRCGSPTYYSTFVSRQLLIVFENPKTIQQVRAEQQAM